MSREKLVGTWKLISFTSESEGQAVSYPMDKDCQGILTLDATGNLNGQLMDPNRPPFSTSKLFDGTPKETENAYKGYFAYWGSYTVDEAKSMIRTTVEGSLFPNWIGTVQDRYYSFEGKQMALTTTPLSLSGSRNVAILRWERDV